MSSFLSAFVSVRFLIVVFFCLCLFVFSILFSTNYPGSTCFARALHNEANFEEERPSQILPKDLLKVHFLFCITLLIIMGKREENDIMGELKNFKQRLLL